MTPPTFVMHWHELVPKVDIGTDGKSRLTVWAGQFGNATGLPPPPNSWASDAANDVACWHIELQPGATVTLPASSIGDNANRRIYTYESVGVRVGDKKIAAKQV